MTEETIEKAESIEKNRNLFYNSKKLGLWIE